jgi:tRNA pseudouridine38-40 synthase
MQRYKIIIAYDGTDYAGWQVQRHCLSIAQCLQDSFFDVFGSSIALRAVSRTDAGVHALGQVATFTTNLSVDASRLHKAWNAYLPLSISIRSLELVDLTYNPHASIEHKTYWYHFFLERPLPHVQRYGFFVRCPVNITKLQDCLSVFLGTHDFRSFCTGDEREDTIRTINEISIYFVPEYNGYRIAIKGPKFLRYMIRRMVGACLCVAAKEEIGVEVLAKALIEKNPAQALPTAPAHGLMLHEVVYRKDQI